MELVPSIFGGHSRACLWFCNSNHVACISSAGVAYFNGALGTTTAALTAFGEGGGRHAFFTGKPLVVDENGHEIRFGWDRFGLSRRTTAAGQVTDYVRDDDGLVAEIVSSQGGRAERTIRREYDDLGRVTRVDYGSGEVETFSYDRWGRLTARARGGLVETYAYDHFGRLVEKDEDGAVTSYAYDAWGNRTLRVTRGRDGAVTSRETRSYDRLGRLVETAADFGSRVTYAYDRRGRLARQTIDGIPVDYDWTRGGRLAAKWFGGRREPMASVAYEYARDGRIAARTANGVRQEYGYDARGRLLSQFVK